MMYFLLVRGVFMLYVNYVGEEFVNVVNVILDTKI
jgi:hypothetical protein